MVHNAAGLGDDLENPRETTRSAFDFDQQYFGYLHDRCRSSSCHLQLAAIGMKGRLMTRPPVHALVVRACVPGIYLTGSTDLGVTRLSQFPAPSCNIFVPPCRDRRHTTRKSDWLESRVDIRPGTTLLSIVVGEVSCTVEMYGLRFAKHLEKT